MPKKKIKEAKRQVNVKKNDDNKNDENKLSYYSIGKHRAVLVIYALLSLAFSVTFFIILLRLLFGLFGIIPILGIGNSRDDLSYLADFLGGFIGIIVGFLADAMFISRWQHLKRYKSLLNLLNKELGNIKTTIKYVWGIDALINKRNGNNKILNVLIAAGLLNEKEELESFDKIDNIKYSLEYYQPDRKEYYNELFIALKAVFEDNNIVGEIRKKSMLQGYSGSVISAKIIKHFTEHDENNYDFEMLNKGLTLCFALDAKRITKISAPTLESVVTSSDEIATFYNLPRYSIWTEEQGNFAKELQYFFLALSSLEENFKVKTSWEFLLICKDLVDRIDNFQKITDLAYYQENVYEYLNSFLSYLRDDKKVKENELLEKLQTEEYSGLKIKQLKKKKPHKHTIHKSYFRYKIKFTYADNTKTRNKFLIDEQGRKIFKRNVLRFEKAKYKDDDFVYLLDFKNQVYDSQDSLYSSHLNEEQDLHKHLPSDFAYSSKYFSDGFKKAISDETNIELSVKSANRCFDKLNENPRIIEEPIKILSEMFKDITTIIPRKYADDVRKKTYGKITVLNDDFIGRAIVKIVKSAYDKESEDGETILRLISPIGSYKNRLLQYIYIRLKILHRNMPVFYIDISKYENEFDINDIDNDLDTIFKITEQYKADKNTTPPLFIIDNIREFQCGINDIYNRVCDFLNNEIKKYKLIIGCDALYTFNIDQQEKIPFLRKKSVTTLNISSMNLSRETESLNYIISCLKLCGEKNDIKNRAKLIRKQLLALNFYTLDSYWLIKILKQTDYLKDNNKDILTLYDKGLFKYTAEMGKKQYDELAKSVYTFEYESQHFDYSELSNNNWKLAREHRSMIDYLVARNYVILLRETILPKDEHTIIQNLGGKLNLFLPKNINRFIVCELSKNDIHNLILFCERNIGIIKNYPKFECQVTYILRILGKKYSECLSGSKYILNLMLNPSRQTDEELIRHSDAEIRQQLFLSRCIYIGLGYLGDVEVFSKYLKTIVPPPSGECGDLDRIADDINRAFHLDYYGDTFKCLDLNGTFDNYSDDDKEKGVNALRKLQIDIHRDIAQYKDLDDGKKAILILQMVTYCSLMKARDYEFKSLVIKEDFITPILKNIRDLTKQINGSESQDKWFNEENSYIGEFLLQVFSEVYKKEIM